MVATIRQQETGYEALVRLAGKARKEGVQLLHSERTGAYVATSGTTAGKRYAVTPHSCECQGFRKWGRCKHVAALQTALGWIEKPVETPAHVPAGTVCRHCEGRGFWIQARNRGRGQFERVDVPCQHCHGTGHSMKAVA
ncbi:MAG TPA: zinc finger domain-containing protein [Thermomicrobiales bacterium]|nr:zinc finger domain-containing protein [Thermomicrobiales bacterium]